MVCGKKSLDQLQYIRRRDYCWSHMKYEQIEFATGTSRYNDNGDVSWLAVATAVLVFVGKAPCDWQGRKSSGEEYSSEGRGWGINDWELTRTTLMIIADGMENKLKQQVHQKNGIQFEDGGKFRCVTFHQNLSANFSFFMKLGLPSWYVSSQNLALLYPRFFLSVH